MTLTKILSVDEILAADDLSPEPVDVPEWGGSVMVRSLTAHEADSVMFAVLGRDGKPDPSKMAGVAERVVAFALVNEDGSSLLTKAQAAALAKKNGAVIRRLSAFVLAKSGLGAISPSGSARPENGEAGEIESAKND